MGLEAASAARAASMRETELRSRLATSEKLTADLESELRRERELSRRLNLRLLSTNSPSPRCDVLDAGRRADEETAKILSRRASFSRTRRDSRSRTVIILIISPTLRNCILSMFHKIFEQI